MKISKAMVQDLEDQIQKIVQRSVDPEEDKTMKRYAVLYDGQLVFNETDNWFDKENTQWIEQKNDEGSTVRAFEKKYGLSLTWKKDKGYNIVREVA